VVWAIANCVSLENEIFEEHVIYNNSSLLLQLGFDLRTLARDFGNHGAALRPSIDARFGEPDRVLGQGTPSNLPSPDESDPGQMLRYAYHYLWNCPSGREFYGRGEYKSFVLSLIAMFPDLALQVDDLYYMGNSADGYLTSVRWSAVGTHRGLGIYGPPTGRRVQFWGITQHRLIEGEVHEEWMMFNEFEVMQQIYRDEPTHD
jgi:predicted ester cyclase